MNNTRPETPSIGSPIGGQSADSANMEHAPSASSAAADDHGSDGASSSLLDQPPSEWFAKTAGLHRSTTPSKLGKVLLFLYIDSPNLTLQFSNSIRLSGMVDRGGCNKPEGVTERGAMAYWNWQRAGCKENMHERVDCLQVLVNGLRVRVRLDEGRLTELLCGERDAATTAGLLSCLGDLATISFHPHLSGTHYNDVPSLHTAMYHHSLSQESKHPDQDRCRICIS